MTVNEYLSLFHEDELKLICSDLNIPLSGTYNGKTITKRKHLLLEDLIAYTNIENIVKSNYLDLGRVHFFPVKTNQAINLSTINLTLYAKNNNDNLFYKKIDSFNSYFFVQINPMTWLICKKYNTPKINEMTALAEFNDFCGVNRNRLDLTYSYSFVAKIPELMRKFKLNKACLTSQNLLNKNYIFNKYQAELSDFVTVTKAKGALAIHRKTDESKKPYIGQQIGANLEFFRKSKSGSVSLEDSVHFDDRIIDTVKSVDIDILKNWTTPSWERLRFSYNIAAYITFLNIDGRCTDYRDGLEILEL